MNPAWRPPTSPVLTPPSPRTGEDAAGARRRHGAGAAFVTVALVVWPTGEELPCGECRGIIADAERSGRGWGYDPLFVPVDHNPEGRTFSQMTDDEKNAISHRGRASGRCATP
ncbi:MAG: non-canonical purine NTP pyrophosphatase [Ilumatobacteraceae bacterium]